MPHSPSSSWAAPFYDVQEALTGYYSAEPHPSHAGQVRRLRAQFPQASTLLELGAGGGQFAVTAAQAGLGWSSPHWSCAPRPPGTPSSWPGSAASRWRSCRRASTLPI
ncbi:hypothetical protein [Deinococcus soli (ex Cha et al. 2016)]|uniref:hypothetical protein n=1 Tax=Deinococcus soli (ex Cha et al. 2016) TaxID=1309411 RepID=UPI00166A2F33|nr:hypothetical protein [Deinococcus soli (ex Cha et al. 2016)]